MDLFNRKKVQKLEAKIASLKQDIIKEQNNCVTLKEILKNTNCSSLLLEENQKLIEWINKILEEFGTIVVYERRSVYIPIYKKEEINPFTSDIELRESKVKTIVIPEIVIQEHNY